MSYKKPQHIIVIGAGAAGMMTAATITEVAPSLRVTLIEKNRGLGKKVLISGGGRCNVTTGIRDVPELLTKYQRGSKFLTTAQYNFPPDQVYEWFEEREVPLKTEADLRVFPASDNGQDVVGVFERLFTQNKVQVILRNPVRTVSYHDDHYTVTLKSGQEITGDIVVLATGGEAYRHTGSTGDGYAFAQQFGHTVTDLAPSLNAFTTQEKWPGKLAGVSFTQVEFSIPKTAVGHTRFQATGPMVFTHKGISGPAPFALAAQIAFKEYTPEQPLPLQMNFIPGSNYEAVYSLLQRYCEKTPTVLLRKHLQQWLPKSVIGVMFELLEMVEDVRLAGFSKAQRRQVVRWLTACEVRLVGRTAGSEFVTAGGVELSEINPRTMESLLQPGLYIVGELLNVDGITGGFNLQASWATGRLAGEAIISTLQRVGSSV